PGAASKSSAVPGLHAPDGLIAVEQEPPAVAGDRHVMTVREAEDDATAQDVHADRVPGEARSIGDAVHDHRFTGDAAAHAHGPQHASAAGGETVEDTVVGAEDDSAGPGGGGRIDVGAGLERPE